MHLLFTNDDDNTDNGNGLGLGLEGARYVAEAGTEGWEGPATRWPW